MGYVFSFLYFLPLSSLRVLPVFGVSVDFAGPAGSISAVIFGLVWSGLVWSGPIWSTSNLKLDGVEFQAYTTPKSNLN